MKSKKYAGATLEYQKAIAQQVVKISAKVESERVVKTTQEGGPKGAEEGQ